MSDKLGVSWLKGFPLVFTITSVNAAAFLLFGYDQRVMSGVNISSYYLETVGNPSTIMLSTITAMYDVGAVIGALLSAFTAEQCGRKRGLLYSTVVLIIGSVLMGACYERIQMMVGRVFTGIGIGYITAVASVYQSEICLPKQRGWHLASQLTILLVGILIAYWLNYGLFFYHSEFQWRFPLLFQIIFAIYILVVTIWLPESPRWLMLHEESSTRGEIVLSKLRNKPVDHPGVVRERNEILEAIRLEIAEESGWADLIKSDAVSTDKRFYLALGAQFMQEMGGINMITYYAPTLLQESLGFSQERSLFFGAWMNVWYVFASLLTWYMIDRIGRRRLFIVMAIGMGVLMAIEAGCVANGSHGASIIAVLCIFLFEGCFTWGWQSSTWVYPAEVLPLKVRAKGVGLAAAACFLGNFLVVEITPPALSNIKWKTYIIFAIFNIVQAGVAWAFYPETALISLEQMDKVFRHDGEKPVKQGIYKFQYSVVQRADRAFHENKAQLKLGHVEAAIEPAADSSSEKEGTLVVGGKM